MIIESECGDSLGFFISVWQLCTVCALFPAGFLSCSSHDPKNIKSKGRVMQ
jgi:hypothetical protein